MVLLQLKGTVTLRRAAKSLLLLSTCTVMLLFYVNYSYIYNTVIFNERLRSSGHGDIVTTADKMMNLTLPLLTDKEENADDIKRDMPFKKIMPPALLTERETRVDDVKREKPLTSLIDIPISFNHTHVTKSPVKYTILWYNPADWMSWVLKAFVKMDTCQYNNCNVTEDRRFLDKSAAVVFGIAFMGMGRSPPKRTNPNQVWVFHSIEAPVYHVFATDYIYGSWDNTMNWSMTFNLDSDVPAPFGTFKTRPQPYTNEPDYGKIYDMKTKMAVWVVSNCGSMSRRKEFVAALMKAGIEVDIYGKCGGQGRFNGKIGDLVKPYMFYLSLENSFCKYYVTEKVIARYNDDVIMLVRGGADYRRLIPNDTYVDAALFPNVTSLAKYLLELSSNRPRYIEMLKNKYRYDGINTGFANPNALCDLCKKLNTNGNKTKTYPHLRKTVVDEAQCVHPNDIIIK